MEDTVKHEGKGAGRDAGDRRARYTRRAGNAGDAGDGRESADEVVHHPRLLGV